MNKIIRPNIVVVGAGFAGLRLAKQLRHSKYRVTLIDKHNYHQFQPLMYQVATARLEPENIAFPLRREFQRSKHIDIRLADVLNVNHTEKLIETSAGPLKYDFLVFAIGCTTNFYGNSQIESNAITMKSMPEAIALRNKILQTFEDSLTATPESLAAMMNLVIVGGGPTGVELAGALAEMKKYVLPKDYPSLDFSQLQIHLIDSGSNTLSHMSKQSQEKSKQYLQELGVKLLLNNSVEKYDGSRAYLKSGEIIKTKNLIWVAGVTGNQIKGIPPETLQKGNRLKVDEFFKVYSMPDVFAIGDIAMMETETNPDGHPQLASVALSQADKLAQNFKDWANLKKAIPFLYHNKGTMATVGKNKAVVDLPKFHFQGHFAWLTWMFVHLMLILGVRSKLKIFLNWSLNYFSNDSTLRLILREEKKLSG